MVVVATWYDPWQCPQSPMSSRILRYLGLGVGENGEAYLVSPAALVATVNATRLLADAHV